jgi:hypothetical protein
MFLPRFDELVNMKDMMDSYFCAVIEVSQYDGRRGVRGNYFAASSVPEINQSTRCGTLSLQRG